MINEVFISRLDGLVGDCDTPFFNYLLYSYGLTLSECEAIIDELRSDIASNRVIVDNLVSALEERFRLKVTDMEKQDKITYLSGLVSEDNDFYIRYLKRYNLTPKDIDLIFAKVRDRILADNISDFEIKRYLEYYFANSVKQASYINDLKSIVGNDYDTLIIRNEKRKYPVLRDGDIIDIVFAIHSQIIDAKEFKKGIKSEFKRQCMLKSEEKKAKCRENLTHLVEGSGDSFSKLVKFKGLNRRDGEIILDQIREDISDGLIQPDEINNVFLTKRFNDYNEGK